MILRYLRFQHALTAFQSLLNLGNLNKGYVFSRAFQYRRYHPATLFDFRSPPKEAAQKQSLIASVLKRVNHEHCHYLQRNLLEYHDSCLKVDCQLTQALNHILLASLARPQ